MQSIIACRCSGRTARDSPLQACLALGRYPSCRIDKRAYHHPSVVSPFGAQDYPGFSDTLSQAPLAARRSYTALVYTLYGGSMSDPYCGSIQLFHLKPMSSNQMCCERTSDQSLFKGTTIMQQPRCNGAGRNRTFATRLTGDETLV